MTRRSVFQAVLALLPWRKRKPSRSELALARIRAMTKEQRLAALDECFPEYARYKDRVVHSPGMSRKEFERAMSEDMFKAQLPEFL